MYGQFAWMAYSRCGLTNELYGSTKISFVRHASNPFKKYSIPLALLTAVRALAEGLKSEFTIMKRSLIRSNLWINSLSFSSDRARRNPEGPPIDRWGLLIALNGSSHPRDQLKACRIDFLCSCSYLLEAMSFTLSVKNKWLWFSWYKSGTERAQTKALQHTAFYDTFAQEVAAQFHSKRPVL